MHSLLLDHRNASETRLDDAQLILQSILQSEIYCLAKASLTFKLDITPIPELYARSSN